MGSLPSHRIAFDCSDRYYLLDISIGVRMHLRTDNWVHQRHRIAVGQRAQRPGLEPRPSLLKGEGEECLVGEELFTVFLELLLVTPGGSDLPGLRRRPLTAKG